VSFPARRWVVGVVACGLLLTGCSHNVMDGRAVSMLFDPDRVGGLPATDGLSGPRAGMPPLAGTVDNTNNGDLDEVVPGLVEVEVAVPRSRPAVW
jgi:hypothetical protein